jgi:hypothetical protein
MNQDLFELFISGDEDKNPTRVVNVTPDIFICNICHDWLGTEVDALEHEVLHPQEHCYFCNRAIYLLELTDNPLTGPKEQSVTICSVCYRNALETPKTFSYRLHHFWERIKRLVKLD